MSPSTKNRSYTEARLERVQWLLRRCFDGGDAAQRRLEESRHVLEGFGAGGDGADSVYDRRLVETLGLSDFGLDFLWMAVAPHLEAGFCGLIARANDNVLLDYVDAALCLRALGADRLERLELRRALASSVTGASFGGLIHLRPRERGANNPLLQELVPAAHLVAWLMGARSMSPVSGAYGQRFGPADGVEVSGFEEGTMALMMKLISGFFSSRSSGFTSQGCGVVLRGAMGSGRTAMVRAAARACGRGVVILDGAAMACGGPETVGSCFVEAAEMSRLYGEVLVVRDADALLQKGQNFAPLVVNVLRRVGALAVLSFGRKPSLDPRLEPTILMEMEMPNLSNGRSLEVWKTHLSSGPGAVGSDALMGAAGRLDLTPLQIGKAVQLASMVAPGISEGLGPEESLEICAKAQIHSDYGALASRQSYRATLSDLVLPDDTMGEVKKILAAVRNRDKVLRRWGLRNHLRRGLGINCLFSGEPGTGKTLSAEVIACELGMDIMRVNVSMIVDKYIGETEKHLSELFASARSDTSLLLFDEADSLFSKRTKVDRSSDRYSNMDVNVLLQLIEEFEGVTVLTTNLLHGIDDAFMRRISFKIHFPLPEQKEREGLWRHLLPATVPTTEEVDFAWLSTVELSGGGVKNAVLRASYEAASDGTGLTMRHLMEAARKEVSGEGRLVREEEWD